MSIGGLIVFGFNASWIFGREYSDRTIRDLLALPISRNIIVFSKFIIAFMGLVLSIYVLVLGLLLGLLIDIPGWSFDVIRQGTLVYIACSYFPLYYQHQQPFLQALDVDIYRHLDLYWLLLF